MKMTEFFDGNEKLITFLLIGIVIFFHFMSSGGIDDGFALIGIIVTGSCILTLIVDYWKKLLNKVKKHD